MNQWFSTYRKIKGDRTSPLIFDFTTEYTVNPGPPLHEAVNAVNKIVETHDGPYTLLVSGGVDSQAMIFSWKQSGHPFSVVHYTYGTNIEDRETLEAFCANNDIDFEIRNFDVDAFINSDEYVQLAVKYDCASPHILTYIKIASLHKETCIMSGNYLQRITPSMNWTILGLDRFRRLTKWNFVPFFLNCTPELAYSFFREEFYIESAQSKYLPFSMGSELYYALKAKTYEFCGFPVLKQSKKLTGFEEIKIKYDEVKMNRIDKLRWAHMPSKRTFDIKFRYALFEVLPGGFYSEKTETIHNEFINRL